MNEVITNGGAAAGEANRYAVRFARTMPPIFEIDCRPRATAAGAHNLMLDGIEAMKEKRPIDGQVKAERERATADLSQRHRGGTAGGNGRRDLRCILYHQAAGLGHGPGDQPLESSSHMAVVVATTNADEARPSIHAAPGGRNSEHAA